MKEHPMLPVLPHLSALAVLMGTTVGTVFAEPIAHVAPMAVSPRDVAEDPADIFDEVASGLFVIGMGEKIYLEAEPAYGFSISGAEWELTGVPTGSQADLSDTAGTLITLVPDVAGVYLLRMTPLDEQGQPTESVDARVYAGSWVGAGVFNTHEMPDETIPHCGNTCCHAESTDPRLNVLDTWLGTAHSQKLQSHLSGERGAEYEVSCLQCHTTGFKEGADNGGFDDLASAIGYDLSDISALVEEAANTGADKWPDLPADLQGHASIQCESCHGPGSNHLGFILEDDHGIGGVDLSPKQCAQCHDSLRPEGGGFYQYNTSTHPITAELAEGHVAERDSCRVCHTGEGFVYGVADGGPIPQLPTHDYTNVTCSTCHDPHGSEYEHGLRLAGEFTFPSGGVAEDPGSGGLCMRCHNSRISDPESTASSSTRGAHYGTAGDMIAGTGAVGFDLTYIGNSAHSTIARDTCVTCHMAESPEGEEGVGGHTFRIRDDRGNDDPSDDFVNAANACGICHGELQTTLERTARGDYDGDGSLETIQDEVTGLLDVLREGILDNFEGTSLSSNGKISITGDALTALTSGQQWALYNYNFVWLDGSYGIHNTSYAIQILQRSYYGVYGHTIVDDFPDIDLRGPVQMSVIPTPTPTMTPIPTPTPAPTPVPEYLATVDLLGVSPRQVEFDETGTFDETATGLRAVGVGEKVYLQAEKVDESVTGYTWSVLNRPNGSTAQLSATTGEMVTFRPDVKGTYLIRLTPQTSRRVIDVYDQRIYAAEWAGTGVFDTHDDPDPVAPQCGTGFCHGGDSGNPDLNVLDQWLKTNHAQKLQLHLNGERGPAYALSCLPCHTVGFNDHVQAVNNGFDDLAAAGQYELENIVNLIADAADNRVDNFPQLPATLQGHASVQCENCHGAGSLHPANLSAADRGIDGATLDPVACARCHDSAHDDSSDLGQGFYQWSSSTHPVTASLADGHVAERDNCRICHTGEGFIATYAGNGQIPQLPTYEYHGATCAVCHDPHGSEKSRELRVTEDFMIPNGTRSYGVANGGICFRCHNSRVDSPESTATSSYRGAHYSAQADVYLGSGAVDFGLPFAASSPHAVAVWDGCVSCHMAESPAGDGEAAPPLVGEHTFLMRDTGDPEDPDDDLVNPVNACGDCHIGLETYDLIADGDYDGDGLVEGTMTEVDGLFALLEPGILEWEGTSMGSHGISIGGGDFANLTAQQQYALYNFNLIYRDGSRGVHNTAYSVQVLQRSYYGVYGHSILRDYPHIYLRGPVQDPVVEGKAYWAVY